MSEGRWKKGALLAALAVVVALVFSATSLFMSPFAVFLKPVSTDLSWSLAVFPQSLLVVSIVYALSCPMIGRAVDRMGPRPIVPLGVVLTAAGLFGLAHMSGSLLQMYLYAFVLGIAGAAISPASLSGVIAGWFEHRRALAIGATLGAAPMLATAAFSPLIAVMIERYGWRDTYQGLALIALCVAGPVTLLLLKQANAGNHAAGPADLPAMRAGDQRPPGMSLAEALRCRDLWLLIAISALLAIMYGGVSGHLVAWQTERGYSTEFSAGLLSAMFVGGVAGPIVSGAVADRIMKPQVLLPFMAAPLLGLALLLMKVDPWLTIVAAGLIGLGFSAWIGQLPTQVNRYFGMRAMGEMAGLLTAAGGINLGIGPVLVGVLRTNYGRYEPAIMVCTGAMAIALICVVMLGPYRRYAAEPQTQPLAVPEH